MSEIEYKPKNQETDSLYNREPGIAIVPGSNYQRYMAQFEQFHTPISGGQPGNPYTYRPYPKMVYRAEHWQGKACCLAAPPDPWEFKDTREYERACLAADQFNKRCQRIVNDETEHSRAREDNWRESPQEAVEALIGRDLSRSQAQAERNWSDRNMSDKAKAEAAAVEAATDDYVPEVPVARRGPGRPRKVDTP